MNNKMDNKSKELLNEMVAKVEKAEIHQLTFYHRVAQAQQEITAPKTQGGGNLRYKYRSCEQILEACKPVLKKYHLLLVLNDDIVEIGNRFYVKAIAKIVDTQSEAFIESVAYAREDDTAKTMATSQLTGSSSSYARKYALSGLFLLDDNKDADKIADEAQNTDTGELADDKTKKEILEKLDENRLNKALAFVQCRDIENLTKFQANKIIEIINKEAKKVFNEDNEDKNAK